MQCTAAISVEKFYMKFHSNVEDAGIFFAPIITYLKTITAPSTTTMKISPITDSAEIAGVN
jgi:hypothetical protein